VETKHEGKGFFNLDMIEMEMIGNIAEDDNVFEKWGGKYEEGFEPIQGLGQNLVCD